MKFLIVDDHAVVREGVAAVLRQAATETVVLQAHDGVSALSIVAAHADIDVVLLDLMLPGTGGLSVLEDLGRRRPGLPVMVLSSLETASDVRRALALGALGYVPKSANPATLLAALTLVLAGETYVPPFVVQDVEARSGAGREEGPRSAGLAALTERQIEVLGLIGADISNKEIAYRLKVSEKTVKAHVTAIFRALNVVNRAQAARVARPADS